MEPGDTDATPSLIELGWLLPDELSEGERRAAHAARESVLEQLAKAFPDFSWEMPVVPMAPVAGDAGDEPAALLHAGAQQRELHGWDFAMVVSRRDLRSHYKSHALAVPSRALAVAALSLARLGPVDDVDRAARRVAALAFHLFGDLNGLWHSDAPDSWMCPPGSVKDLERTGAFDPAERERLLRALREVADLRLEESGAPASAPRFYIRASLERAGEIASAVFQARPWELPLRLSRLTAAASSALLILLITAEVWDLGTRQAARSVVTLSLVVIVATTAFVLNRQKLLLRRTAHRPTEREVVTNVSATLVVLLGLITTYGLLFALTLGLGHALFSTELVARWAPDTGSDWRGRPLLAMAGIVSSLGLLIGALGASLEGNHYFRHVIYADEET